MPPYYVAVPEARAERIAEQHPDVAEIFKPENTMDWVIRARLDIIEQNRSVKGPEKPVPGIEDLGGFVVESVKAGKRMMVIEADDTRELKSIAGPGIKPVN